MSTRTLALPERLASGLFNGDCSGGDLDMNDIHRIDRVLSEYGDPIKVGAPYHARDDESGLMDRLCDYVFPARA